MTCAKKGYCEKEVQVQGHISLLPQFCNDSFWQVEMDSFTSTLPFRDLLVESERCTALVTSPPVFSAGYHKQRGKFSTHRGFCGFFEIAIYSKAARKENFCKCFCDQFLLLLYIYPVGRQTISI